MKMKMKTWKNHDFDTSQSHVNLLSKIQVFLTRVSYTRLLLFLKYSKVSSLNLRHHVYKSNELFLYKICVY